MKISVGELKRMIDEAKIGASPGYMKKEALRQALQDVVTTSVSTGQVADEKALQQVFQDMDTALKALKMIPFDVWKKLSA